MMHAHAPSSRSLEREFHRIASGKVPARLPKLKRWALVLVDFLTGAQSIAIREKTFKNGTSQWIIYEASSDTRRVFDTEQAVRVWLETGGHVSTQNQ